MRSLRRNLEVQLDTPWLLTSRRQMIAEELFLHLNDHRDCLEEEGLPKDVALAEAWAQFGDLKALAGEFLTQHRLEAYAFYATFVVLFAGCLWPLTTLVSYLFSGDTQPLATALTWGAFFQRLLVTAELFWLFVLVRTAHCTSTSAARRWVIIGLLFPGYLILGVLTPFLLSGMFYYSSQANNAPWLHWFHPQWMKSWISLLLASPLAPSWMLSTEAGRESFVVTNIIAVYLIRAYAVEGCWQGRDWPRLLVMTFLMILGLTLFFHTKAMGELIAVTTSVGRWSHASTALQAKGFILSVLRHLLLVGYFLGGLRAYDAVWGLVMKARQRAGIAKEALA